MTFNPVVKAYAVVFSGLGLSQGDGGSPPDAKKQKVSSSQQGDVILFMEEHKVTEEVSTHLFSGHSTGESVNITVKPYHEVIPYLRHYLQNTTAAAAAEKEKVKVLLDANSLNWGVYEAVRGEGHSVPTSRSVEGVVLDTPSVVAACKTLKNATERQGIRACHVRDGVALTAFLSWLNTHMASSPFSSSTNKEENEEGACAPLSEHEAAVKLESFRAAMPLYVSPSFDTISSYGSNGAVSHYHPPSTGSAQIGHSSLYLLDSGGQYLDGTTDVTRTLYFGPCEFTEGEAGAEKFREMRDAFTYVLKAHIALATAKFPEDTLGYRLVRTRLLTT